MFSSQSPQDSPLWAILYFRPDQAKQEAVGCPVLDFLGVRHTPVPRIFAPGVLDLSGPGAIPEASGIPPR